MNRATSRLAVAAGTLLLGACAGMSAPMMAPVDNAALPDAVRVPAGETQKMWTVGAGEITYECREKKDAAGQYEWAFVGPVASLKDGSGKVVGKYYAGPTWESMDGSKVTAKQVAVAPQPAGNIPLQLVKAEPAMGMGSMQGVTYIQRLNTKGGVAPASGVRGRQHGREAAGGIPGRLRVLRPLSRVTANAVANAWMRLQPACVDGGRHGLNDADCTQPRMALAHRVAGREGGSQNRLSPLAPPSIRGIGGAERALSMTADLSVRLDLFGTAAPARRRRPDPARIAQGARGGDRPGDRRPAGPRTPARPPLAARRRSRSAAQPAARPVPAARGRPAGARERGRRAGAGPRRRLRPRGRQRPGAARAGGPGGKRVRVLADADACRARDAPQPAPARARRGRPGARRFPCRVRRLAKAAGPGPLRRERRAGIDRHAARPGRTQLPPSPCTNARGTRWRRAWACRRRQPCARSPTPCARTTRRRSPDRPRRGSAARQRPWSRPTCRSSIAPRCARASRPPGRRSGASTCAARRASASRVWRASARAATAPGCRSPARRTMPSAERLAGARAAPAARGVAGRRSRAVDPARAGAADARARSRASSARDRRGARAAGRGARRRVRDAGARQFPGPRARRLAVDRQREPGSVGRAARAPPATCAFWSRFASASCRRARSSGCAARSTPARPSASTCPASTIRRCFGWCARSRARCRARCSARACAASPTATRSSCSRPCAISNSRACCNPIRPAAGARRTTSTPSTTPSCRSRPPSAAPSSRVHAPWASLRSACWKRRACSAIASMRASSPTPPGSTTTAWRWLSPMRQRRSSSSRNATGSASPTTSCANAWPKD